MSTSANAIYVDADLELLPPERVCEDETVVCPCCRRTRPRSAMDKDGCGLCDECLAPVMLRTSAPIETNGRISFPSLNNFGRSRIPVHCQCWDAKKNANVARQR